MPDFPEVCGLFGEEKSAGGFSYEVAVGVSIMVKFAWGGPAAKAAGYFFW